MMKRPKELLGGMALIEGVMMKSKEKYAIAVRNPEGKIMLKKFDMTNLSSKYPFLKWVFIRGVAGLFEMLILGINALNYSADIAIADEKSKKENKKGDDLKNKDLWEKTGKDGMSAWHMALSLLTALALAFILFKLIPLSITQFLFSKKLITSNIAFNIVDGLLRLSIFLLYIYIISLLPDMKRVFQYHGAEHRTVHCYEAGEELNVENVQKFSTKHPRCGTSFIIFVLIVTILVFSLVPLKLPFWWKMLYRLPLIPLIASLSYELLRFSANHLDKWYLKWMVYPGLWTQSITTREPDDSQAEVAIASLKMIA